MNNSVEYIDGKLIISLSAMQDYLESIANIRNTLRGKHEESGPNFKYNKREDYVSFRVLDGMFFPYIETCIGGLIPCASYKKNAYLMKTMVGTIEIAENVDLNSLLPASAIFEQYSIAVVKGPYARKAEKETRAFPEIFWDSIKNSKNIEIPIHPEVYKLISINSSVTIKSMSMNLYFSGNDARIIKSNSDDLKNIKAVHSNIKLGSIKVAYEPTKLQYICLNAIGKILSRAQNTTSESHQVEMDLDSSSSNEILKYLANPSQITYQIKESSNIASHINIILPGSFATLLVNRLNFSSIEVDKHKSIEIILSKDNVPYTETFIDTEIQGIVNDINSDSSTNQSETRDIISNCAVYLKYMGASSQAEYDNDL